jgi:branched-chain amino acid transport system permease protein
LSQILAFGALLLPRAWGAGPAIRSLPAPFEASFAIGEVRFDGNDLIALVVAPLLIASVAVLLRFTDTGTAVRAAADRVDRASMLGIPVRRLEAQIWTLATVMSFVSVVLTAGVSSLPFGLGVGLAVVLRALAALVIGRMTDLVSITATALAIGMLESGIRWNTGDTRLASPILAALIIVGLLVQRRGDTRADREESSSWNGTTEVRPVPAALSRLPEVRAMHGSIVVLIAAAVLLGPLLMGTNGQLKAGHRRGVRDHRDVGGRAHRLGRPGVARSDGIRGRRGRGRRLVHGRAGLGAVDVDGGGRGDRRGRRGAGRPACVAAPRPLPGGDDARSVARRLGMGVLEPGGRLDPSGAFPRPALLHRIELDTPLRLYYFALAVLALALLALRGVRRSRFGRVLVALRDNEPGMVAYGVDPVRTKLGAFAISGFVAASPGWCW